MARFVTAFPAGVLLLAACAAGVEAPVPSPAETAALFGSPSPVAADAADGTVVLGRALFVETRLSSDGSLSCATCHRPDQGFTVRTALSPAFPTKAERRNPPTLLNAARRRPLLWDGRVADLDAQPLSTIADRLHFNNDPDLLAAEIGRDADYRRAFAAAFGDDAVTAPRMARAIAAYVRTLVSTGSPFDRYMAGDADAMAPAAKRGLALFVGKAGCAGCHRGPDLSDGDFHNLGVPDGPLAAEPRSRATLMFDAKRMEHPDWERVDEDLGRELVTKDAGDRGKFRTMGLRDVALTAPYMHNGALPTLAAVVAFYDLGGGIHPDKAATLEPLGLTAPEQRDLVAFLEALTGESGGRW